MSEDILIIIFTILFTVALILYVYMTDKYIKLACGAAALLLLFGLVYFLFKPERRESVDQFDETVESDTEISESVVDAVPMTQEYYFTDNVQILSKSTSVEGINHVQFEEMALSASFIESMCNAMKDSLKIKFKRLKRARLEFNKKLSAMNRTNKGEDQLMAMMNKLKNGEKSVLEDTIKEIDCLLREIVVKMSKVDRASVEKAMKEVMREISDLVGRDDVKDFLALQIYSFSRNPRTFLSNFQHMIIMGPSGIGKTRLANAIGKIYSKCGILVRDTVYQATKTSFTTAYVDESAKMTKKLLLANLEGVVFIDEAYDLAGRKMMGMSADHGEEAITEMINFIDKMIGMNIIICSGYEKDMRERFMKANEGIPRRFPHQFVLSPYKEDQLTSILIKSLMNNCRDIKVGRNERDLMYSLVKKLNDKDVFTKQGGDMLNLAESIGRMAYGIPGCSWESDYEKIITGGFNDYLKYRGMSVKTGFVY